MAYTKQEFDDFKIKQIIEPLLLHKDILLEIKQKVIEELHLALGKDTHSSADLKCFPTWLQDLPTGCEHGMFFILTLYLTNFHVVFIHLKGENKYRIEPQTFEVPENLHDPQELFDYIVEKMALCVINLKLEREPLPVAMVMSQPLYHVNLSSAILLSLAKFTRLRGLENKDIGQLMKDALRRNKKTHLELIAVINDVTGVFVSCAWRHGECKVSVIVDAGCNAGYMEKVSKMEMLDKGFGKPEMLVNTEMGHFGMKGQLELIRTVYDKEVDAESSNKGNNTFEKLVGGQWVGEISRKIMLKAIAEQVLFDGNSSPIIQTRNALKAHQVKVVLSEKGAFYNTPLMFDKMGITSPSTLECSKVYAIMEAVVMRSAYLVAAFLAAIIEKIDQPHIVIGIDGSLYCSMPSYHKWIEEKVKELVPPNYTFELVHAMDAYGRGAAIVTALAMRENYIYENLNNMKNN